MAKIDVTIYSLPEEECGYCRLMKGTFTRWVKDHPQHEVTAVTLSAKDNREALLETGATTAPVYIVKRGNKETIVSGRNPDRLTDALEGLDSIWDM